jgi:hypothetical protein
MGSIARRALWGVLNVRIEKGEIYAVITGDIVKSSELDDDTRREIFDAMQKIGGGLVKWLGKQVTPQPPLRLHRTVCIPARMGSSRPRGWLNRLRGTLMDICANARATALHGALCVPKNTGTSSWMAEHGIKCRSCLAYLPKRLWYD